MNSFNEFIEYVYSFYGDGGLYDQKRTREQIAYATLLIISMLATTLSLGAMGIPLTVNV